MDHFESIHPSPNLFPVRQHQLDLVSAFDTNGRCILVIPQNDQYNPSTFNGKGVRYDDVRNASLNWDFPMRDRFGQHQ